MQPTEHSIKIERTAHYYTLGDDIQSADHIWLLIHGYGQLASRMISRFNNENLDKHYFIAPEGLSKHYVRRKPNYVGATWMTQEHRLDEISDYLAYLSQVIEPIVHNMKPHQKLNILGFSQGTSTMWRYINHSRLHFHTVINWAGEFPPELDYQVMLPYLNTISHKYFCVGNNDEYLTEEHKDKLKLFVSQNNLGFKFKFFDRTHVIDQKTFGEIMREVL